jgi:hypothetical protein
VAASAALVANTMANLRNLSDIAPLPLHGREPATGIRWFMISDKKRPDRIEVQCDLIKYFGQTVVAGNACEASVRYFLTLLAGPFVTSFVCYLDLRSPSPTRRVMLVRQSVAYCRKRTRAGRETALGARVWPSWPSA